MAAQKCAHTNDRIAAELLCRDGHISVLEAIYDARCPIDGATKRNTRMAATIHTLRHVHGWGIRTVNSPGMLAHYVLVHQGRFPGVEWVNPISPLRDNAPTGRTPEPQPPCVSVPAKSEPNRWTIEQVPAPQVYWCPHCLQAVENITPLLGGMCRAYCRDCGRVVGVPTRPSQPVPRPKK